MEEFPDNSRSPQQPDVPKKVEKIIEGEVVRRKRPLGKRFVEAFIEGDTNTVANYVVMEVLLPALKDAIADAISQGIEKTMFGKVRSASRHATARPSSAPGYVSYNRYAPTQQPRRDDTRGQARPARGKPDYKDIYVNSRAEGDAVLSKMYDLLESYEVVSLLDLYDMLGEKGDYTDEKWGWTNLGGSRVTRNSNGYLLELPKPVSLD